MAGEAREAAVVVCSETCRLMVYRTKKTVWVASGEFQGRDVSGKGKTFSSAVEDWKSNVKRQEFN